MTPRVATALPLSPPNGGDCCCSSAAADDDDDVNDVNDESAAATEATTTGASRRRRRPRSRPARTPTTRRDLFLSADERYDVWVVKAAERPELLERYGGDGDDDVCDEDGEDRRDNEPATKEEKLDDYDADVLHKDEGGSCSASFPSALPLSPPPLTDGCDIPGWRDKGLVSLSVECRQLLSVGPGCRLLRRESQLLPFMPPLLFCRPERRRSPSSWETMKLRFSETTTTYCCSDGDDSAVPSETATTVRRRGIRRVQYRQRDAGSSDAIPLHPWFERENVPVVVDGCADDWEAMRSCTFENLVDRFGHLQWRYSDAHAETTTLRTYRKYAEGIEGTADDAPLAIYDSVFGEKGDERACILDEYSVPSCFRSDLFELLEEEGEGEEGCLRPPYRWILIGPARSGTGLHVDPVGTHAWVTLVEGCKRWILFPPDTCKESIYMQEPQIPSSIWFRDYYDDVMSRHGNDDVVELVQYPGETVYVPAGWPHLVLNLDLSVALTHNYATEFPSVARLRRAVRNDGESRLADAFDEALKRYRPDLL